MKRPIEAILFDLDGTLADTREDIAASLNFTLSRFHRPARSLNEITRFIGDGYRVLLQRALGEADERVLDEAVAVFREHYTAHCAERTVLYPGVMETLESLAPRPLAVVTNKSEAASRAVLKALDAERFFSVLLGGDSHAEKKPSPGPLREAMRRLKAAPGSTLMVGDSPSDVQAGRQAGTRTCAVTFGYRTAEELRAASPDFSAETFPDIIRFLD